MTTTETTIASDTDLASAIYQVLVGKAHAKGVPDETIRQLATSEEGAVILDQFVEVMARAAGLAKPVFVHDKTADGWELVENKPRRITSIRDLELVPFLRDGEPSVIGEEMARRARVEFDADYGQHDAEYMLEYQDEIPVEFRKYYLVFTATVWVVSRRYRYVPYLYWDGERWILYFYWLGRDFGSGGRLVRPRK